MTTSLPLDSIVIGERDRSEDMGDTAITAYDPEQVAAAITDPDEWEDFLRSHRTVNDWFTKVREARPARLRLIGGSQ